MKKILISITAAILLALSGYSQSGSGTIADPYYGTVATAVTWDLSGFPGGIVYVGVAGTAAYNDLTVTTGGNLTIGSGITVIFMLTNSDLIVTGSGILNATGTASSQVVFTRNPSLSHWGHISFETPGSGTPITGTGSFTYCTVEYGYAVTSGTLPSNAGGGIQVNASNVVISYCLFRNNYSNFGGAVTVNAGRNTIIRNSRFTSNSANEAGGAVLLWTSSTALIENCIFEQNYSRGASTALYSGGAVWLLSNSSVIVNSTFIRNTSDRPGDAVFSYNATTSRIVNSIFWGSNDQYARNGTPGVVAYCAFETTRPANALNSIILNSVNTAADGPNFMATDGSDWSLSYVSPCRDAGTNTYTGVTVPALDYDGMGRVGTKDIGTYECQYSRWSTTAGSTAWTTAANWDGGVPVSSVSNVIVPAGATNYPTGTVTQDFTIGAGKVMVIEQGARVTLDNLTNNGTLELNSTAAGIGSLIINGYTRGAGGSEEIQLYLSGGGNVDDDNFLWHYISTPVSSLAVSTFAPGTTLDLAQYIESRPTLSLSQGWVAFDGYIYSTGGTGGPTFSSLTPGKGYDYWDNADNTFTFSGLFNTTDVTVTLGYSGSPTLHGFNLLGNPFSSGLNWDDIADGVYSPYPANTSKGLYFTRDNVQCSYVSGVGIPGDVTGIIPPMQGFFVKTSEAGHSITLPAAARTNDNIHPRYKGSSTIPLVRLEIMRDSSTTDETVIRFDDLAKTDLDNDFDALKMFITDTKTQIYSKNGTTSFAINGQPFPESFVEIPLTVNLTKDTIYSISATQLQNLTDYYVILKDVSTGTETDLKTVSAVSFTGTAGTINDRFVLKVGVMAAQSVTFGALTARTYGDADFTVAATASSGLAVSFTSDNTNVATVTNGLVHITGAGTAVITASQPGSASYLPAVPVAQTLTVNKANQTITFAALPEKTDGDADFAPEITISSGLVVSLASDNTGVATIAGGMIHITGAGSAIITASQPGDANYLSATSAMQTLTVNTPTGIEDPLAQGEIFNIYSANSIITIETISASWDGKRGSVRVFDLAGKPVADLRNSEFRRGSLIQVQPLTKGMYIVELVSDGLRFVGKVVVK